MDKHTSTTSKQTTLYNKPNVIRKLYDWVLVWAEHPNAPLALFLIAFAEATFFPIPPDVLLIAMAVAAPHKALRFAIICTLGSLLGGIVGYAMGWGLWANISQYFYLYVPGFSEQGFNTMAAHFSDNTFWTIFTAGFTPIPFKIFTITAGAAAVPVMIFIAGAAISRGLRFGILSALIMWFGPSVKHWIDRYFNLLTLLVMLILIAIVVVMQYM